MDCPVCKNAMITLELRKIEIDHCIECGGIWLDSGELELLFDDENKAKSVLESFTADENSQEKKRKCPICMKNMQKIIVGKSDASLLIDKCTEGHGLWFDRGELENIFDKTELDKDNKIKKILHDMFDTE